MTDAIPAMELAYIDPVDAAIVMRMLNKQPDGNDLAVMLGLAEAPKPETVPKDWCQRHYIPRHRDRAGRNRCMKCERASKGKL